MKVYIGIDPGANGGLVALHDRKVCVTAMPKTEAGVWEWLSDNRNVGDEEDDSPFCYIEQVRGFIGFKRGKQGNPGSSMFNFGWSYGGLRMALIAAEIPFRVVPPQVWQRALQIRCKGPNETDSQWKNRLREEARKLFPKLDITLAKSDALLIAHYCRETREGRIK